jgi:hypothetical protein
MRAKRKVPKALVARELDVLPQELAQSATNVLELDLKEIEDMIDISDKESLRVFTQLKRLFANQVGGVQGAKSTLVAIKDGLGMKTEIGSEFDMLQRLALRIQLFDLLVSPRIHGPHKADLIAVSHKQLLIDGISRLPPILGASLTIEHDNLAAVQKASDRSRAKVYSRVAVNQTQSPSNGTQVRGLNSQTKAKKASSTPALAPPGRRIGGNQAAGKKR